MTYLELSDQAQENAVLNYCSLMGINVNSKKKLDVIEWFEKYNHDVLTDDGQLIHWDENKFFSDK